MTCLGAYLETTVDSKELEHGPGRIYASLPSSLGLGLGGQSHSNFLASTVYQGPRHEKKNLIQKPRVPSSESPI